MAKIGNQKDGVYEIDSFAWVITAGKRSYIYSGHPRGLTEAVRSVRNAPENGGTTVQYRKIVG